MKLEQRVEHRRLVVGNGLKPATFVLALVRPMRAVVSQTWRTSW